MSSPIAELYVRVTGDTSDVTRKLAGAQRSMDDFGNKTNKVSSALEGHKLSLGRVERALASYVGHAAGANAVTESLSVAFGSFAVGGGVVAGALLGIGAIVGAYELLTAETKKALEEQDKLTKSLSEQFRPKTGTGSAVGDAFTAAQKQQADARRQLRALMADSGGPLGRDQAAIDAQTERLRQANEAIGRAEARGTNPLATVSVTGESASALDAAFQKRIDILSKGLVFENSRAKITAELVGIEHTLESQVASGTLTLEKRITAMTRLGQVVDALAQKFTTSSNTGNTSLASLVGITGNGETAVARAITAFGGPMGNVKMNSNNGILVRPGQADLIGALYARDLKNLENADKNAKATRDAIWGAAMQGAQIIVNALNIGGGGPGSNLGGALGSTAGSAIGYLLGAGGGTLGALGGPVGSMLLGTAGTIMGSLIGGLFDHKSAVDRNTIALNNLSARLTGEPAGFKVQGYNYAASDAKTYRAMTQAGRRLAARGGRNGFQLQGT